MACKAKSDNDMLGDVGCHLAIDYFNLRRRMRLTSEFRKY